METQETHRNLPRRRTKHKRRPPMPLYARIAIPVSLLVLALAVFWHSLNIFGGPAEVEPPPPVAAPFAPPTVRTVAWERDMMDTLDSAVQNGQSGNITAAEVDVDRAEAIVTAARLQSRTPSPEFFDTAIAALDHALQQRADNQRLFEHVTDARIALAALRSSQNVEGGAANPEAENEKTAAGNGAAPTDYSEVLPGSERKKVVIAAPRAVGTDTTLNPKALGGNYLDATLMPGSAEALMFPVTRLLSDNVRVEDLTIEGAAETLDGVHWRNVTFIGTRLRYEGGALELENVHFVRCTFGLPTTSRGAQLANAIALGQTSFTIER